jgi:TatD DNase family protein
VAIGETGLDACYEHSPMPLQRQWLLRYFALAKEVKLPVIFHCREAFAELFSHADREYRGLPALLHCFTGTREEARGVLDRGWLLSISGIVTFKKSESLRDVVRFVPLDRLVIETDTPYLAPEGKRGKMNEPQYVVETARKIAEVKGISLEQVFESTTENALKFFSLSKRGEEVKRNF